MLSYYLEQDGTGIAPETKGGLKQAIAVYHFNEVVYHCIISCVPVHDMRKKCMFVFHVCNWPSHSIAVKVQYGFLGE